MRKKTINIKYSSKFECKCKNIIIFFSDANRKKLIDVRNKNALRYSGWNPSKKNVIIIHGFNGTESKTPMTFIRNG